MTANRLLAEQRGVSEEDCLKIDAIHEVLDWYINNAIEQGYSEHMVLKVLTEYDYDLQTLWGFPHDKEHHTYFKLYQFKKSWYNRSFLCNSTEQVFTMPKDVRDCQFFQWGHAYIDTGRLNSYARFSNCTEIDKGETE